MVCGLTSIMPITRINGVVLAPGNHIFAPDLVIFDKPGYDDVELIGEAKGDTSCTYAHANVPVRKILNCIGCCVLGNPMSSASAKIIPASRK